MLDNLRKKKMLESLKWDVADKVMGENATERDGAFKYDPYSEHDFNVESARPRQYGEKASMPASKVRGTSRGGVSDESTSKKAPILPIIKEEMHKEYGDPKDMLDEFGKRQTDRDLEEEKKRRLQLLFRQA